VALNGAHLMHDAYNLILADHLAFAMGAGGFLLGLVTGRLRRRRKTVASKFTITTALTRAFAMSLRGEKSVPD